MDLLLKLMTMLVASASSQGGAATRGAGSRRLFRIGRDRTAISVQCFFAWLGEQCTKQLQIVTSDTWGAYPFCRARDSHVPHAGTRGGVEEALVPWCLTPWTRIHSLAAGWRESSDAPLEKKSHTISAASKS